MVRYHVSMAKLEAVFISHVHGDHVFGLFGLLSTFGMGGRTAPLHVYGPGNLRPFINFFLSYNDWLPYEIAFHQVNTRFPEVIMETRSLAVMAFPLLHGIETYGYIFREKDPLWNIRKECIGEYGLTLTEIGTLKRGEDVYRADGSVIRCEEAAYKPYVPRSYAYVSDTAVFPGEPEVLRGVSVLYHETTFLTEHEDKAAARFHSTTRQAAQVAADSGVSKLLIGHYSSRNTDHLLYQAECREVFPETYAASDGDVFEI
jgi:Metal-dependent hydrolases of the beta-lactamase superfamily III